MLAASIGVKPFSKKRETSSLRRSWKRISTFALRFSSFQASVIALSIVGNKGPSDGSRALRKVVASDDSTLIAVMVVLPLTDHQITTIDLDITPLHLR